jgi:hypothetical protein
MFVVIGLPMITFVIFGLWVAAWLAFCFLYGTKHSRLGRQPDQDAPLQQPAGWPYCPCRLTSRDTRRLSAPLSATSPSPRRSDSCQIGRRRWVRSPS